MTTQIQKWGNSLALRIPKAIAEQVGITQSSEIEFSVQDGKIIVAPTIRKQYELAVLVAQITPENLHSETDWDEAQGREEW